MKVQITGFKCERCGYIWRPRLPEDKIKICPKCKSAYWNVPRRKKKK